VSLSDACWWHARDVQPTTPDGYLSVWNAISDLSSGNQRPVALTSPALLFSTATFGLVSL
jgi:hypothetical protein